MKKVLLLLLSLVVIASFVEAKIVRDSVYQIPKTKVAPVIDGQQDAIWKAVDWERQRIYNVGDPPATPAVADSGMGISGMSKVMWDANNVYWLFYTIDDVAIDIPANAGWNQDAIELYFDGTNDHATETSLKSGVQYQFTIPHWMQGQEAGRLGACFGTVIDTTGIEFKIRDVPDTEGFVGWMTEVKIPLSALGVDGSSITTTALPIGFELQQDEADDATAGRTVMSKWWSNSNNSWANAGIWGYAELSPREVDTVLAINKTTATITVDGDMDAAYLAANPATTNLFRVGDPPAAETADTDPAMGSFITAYPLWDATNYYIFLDVVDNILIDIPANAVWNQDAVELYFDGTNDHATETSLKSGVQYQFTVSHWMMGSEVGRLGTCFGTVIDTTGIQFKIKDRDARYNSGALAQQGSGYNVEVKIPLAALGVDGASIGDAGLPIGWELQMDNASDATAGRVGMQKWWSASNNSWANAGIWGYAKLVTKDPKDVEKNPSGVVSSYNLDQNYPNPFNPSTQITYTIPKSEKVRVTVYNLLGKEVAELVNGTKNAGTHTVNFSAANLSSGIYFYKLETSSTVLSKKMMLLK